MRQIVVGIDGSSSSHPVLEWAAREAARREARLIVVHAWEIPASAYGGYPQVSPDPEIYRSAAAERVRQAMLTIDPDAVPLGVEERLVRGEASAALLNAAPDADLIGLGSNRRGGFGRLLLGSTSRDVVRDAEVAVVIAPTLRSPIAA
jgi:nucleotide-binding universal stress UspA family protein